MYAVEHARCWRGGVVWPTWYPDLVDGLGAPEPRARPPLPLAVHAALALAFDDAVTATSLSTLLVPVAAGLVALFVARRRGLATVDAMVVGGVWAVLPYLVVTLHQRAALQEAWAVALLPWVLHALLPPRPAGAGGLAGAAVAFATLVGAQLLIAFTVVIVIAAAHLVSPSRRLAGAAVAGSAGLVLAAASWIPNLASLGRVQSGVFTSAWFDWRHRFVLGSGSLDPGLGAAMTWAFAGVAAAALVLFASGRAGRRAAVAVLGAGAMATPLAAPLYAGVPGLAILQFPWRWLAVASGVALVAGMGAPRRWRAAVLAALVAPVMAIDPIGSRLPAGPPLSPSKPRPEVARAATRYGVPPILPPFPAMVPAGVSISGALAAGRRARSALPVPEMEGPAAWQWSVRAEHPGEIVVPLLAAPGWLATVDGVETPWAARDGLVSVGVGPGLRAVRLRQVPLPEDIAGWVASAFGLAALVGWALRRRWTRGGRSG